MAKKCTVGQINLAGAELATNELPIVAETLGLDVVLAQEHYPIAQSDTASRFLQCGDKPRACIYVRRQDLPCALLQHLSNTHCTVCHVLTDPEGIYMVSAYFQYSDDIDAHLEHLGMVLDSLKGKKVIIGVDSNAHSPMWYCEPRQYTGRGPDVTHRRESMEAFILARGLRLINQEGEPATFATANGTSNIDLTLTTRGIPVTGWRVWENEIESDHRLITYEVASQDTPRAQPLEEPTKLRDRGVDWSLFERRIHGRVGNIRWNRSASSVCAQFTALVGSTAKQTLGVAKSRNSNEGHKWWTADLDRLRCENNRLRRAWQSTRRAGGPAEAEAKELFHAHRRLYRGSMEEAQLLHIRKTANSGNLDPWGQAYRVASGRIRPPSNVINGTKFAEGYAAGVDEAMHSLMGALCPDDDVSRDTLYHRQVRFMASLTPAGVDAPPPTDGVVAGIVRDLPNTAPGIDGITARIIKHTWAAASVEFAEVFRRCVQEGTFPDVWKDGRLIVLPKGNGKPLVDPKAYRPVTLLPILGKILERVMLRCAPQITASLSDCQHGFTRGRSTVSALKAIFSVAKESTSKYVQAVFLDISGAFDNAWWPMIMLKVKRGGCPPNIYKMLTDYFVNRRMGLFVGSRVVWKAATMGCPQGSVLGPTLWNVLMDDLLRLPLPGGVSIVAYADDVTILIESASRASIETTTSTVLKLVDDWGVRNRLDFSPAKSLTMTIRGKFQRPPIIRFRGDSVRSVASTTVLGVVVDSSLSFAQHAVSIGERATNCFGKMSRVSASSWGIRYKALRVLYLGTYIATVTYAAACWYERASLHVVRSALLRTQRPALILLTKAYRSTSSAALPVLAGVLPADLEVIRAGGLGEARESATKEELRGAKLRFAESAAAAWQERWDTSDKGRELYRFFPDVRARIKATWIEPDYETSQLLSGHGCFRGRLHRMKLAEVDRCHCGGDYVEDAHHALWECELYSEARRDLLDNVKVLEVGPVYYGDLVGSEANFRRFKDFAREWHRIRSGLERERGEERRP